MEAETGDVIALGDGLGEQHLGLDGRRPERVLEAALGRQIAMIQADQERHIRGDISKFGQLTRTVDDEGADTEHVGPGDLGRGFHWSCVDDAI